MGRRHVREAWPRQRVGPLASLPRRVAQERVLDTDCLRQPAHNSAERYARVQPAPVRVAWGVRDRQVTPVEFDLADAHDVYTWGDQENGVAGHGETEGHQYLPRLVAALRDKESIQVAACGFHTAALTGTWAGVQC